MAERSQNTADPTEESQERVNKNSKKLLWLLFSLLSLLYLTGYVTRLNFTAAIASIVEANVLTKPEAGTIGTALFIAYGTGQILSGILSDRIKPEGIITAGLLLTITCNVLMPLAQSVALMAIIWGINGLAQAFFWPPIIRILARYSDSSLYTKGVWLVSFGSYVGTILVYVLTPLEISSAGWGGAFGCSAGFALIVLAVWLVSYHFIKKKLVPVEQTAQTDPSGKNDGSETETVRKSKGLFFSSLLLSGSVFLMIAVAAQGFMKDGIQSWLPTFFSESFGVSAETATFSNIILPVFSILATSVSAFLFEKVFKNERSGLFVFSERLRFCACFWCSFTGRPVLLRSLPARQ